jgi:hypothetical protein
MEATPQVQQTANNTTTNPVTTTALVTSSTPDWVIREAYIRQQMQQYNLEHLFASLQTDQPNYKPEDYDHDNKKRYSDSGDNEDDILNDIDMMIKEKNMEMDENTIDKKTKTFAKFLHDNCDSLGHDDVSYYVMKCLSNEDCNHIVYDYILTNHVAEPKKYTSIAQFSKDALYYLNHFQTKMVNVMLEDENWIMHNSHSTEYILGNRQIWFENTMDRQDATDRITMDYINKMVRFLDNLGSNVDVMLSINNKCATHVVCIKCRLVKEDCQ